MSYFNRINFSCSFIVTKCPSYLETYRGETRCTGYPSTMDAVTHQRTGSHVTFELVPHGALPLTVDQQHLDNIAVRLSSGKVLYRSGNG